MTLDERQLTATIEIWRRGRENRGGCRYSRGALYSNFGGKEELFVAVIQEEHARRNNFFRSLLKDEPSGKSRLKKMRDAIAELMTDHDWIALRAEFEVGAAVYRDEPSTRDRLECLRSRKASQDLCLSAA
jgi:AcrR family transcriptional regulator